MSSQCLAASLLDSDTERTAEKKSDFKSNFLLHSLSPNALLFSLSFFPIYAAMDRPTAAAATVYDGWKHKNLGHVRRSSY